MLCLACVILSPHPYLSNFIISLSLSLSLSLSHSGCVHVISLLRIERQRVCVQACCCNSELGTRTDDPVSVCAHVCVCEWVLRCEGVWV